jgi:uncharacterized membrane protein YfcA
MIWALLAAAAFGAGFVNSFAGGGSLLSFPALVFAGVPAVTANATSTIALFPGGLSGAWAYRGWVAKRGADLRLLALPSAAGGLLGSFLLLHTPERLFRDIVPWLILFACAMLAFQAPISRNVRTLFQGKARHSAAAVWAAQFLIAVYGGYFGAGIGILMLATFGILLEAGVQESIALKNALNLFINGVAVGYFLWMQAADLRYVAVMAAAAVAGGLAGARFAQRLSPALARGLVIAVGVGLAAKLLLE